MAYVGKLIIDGGDRGAGGAAGLARGRRSAHAVRLVGVELAAVVVMAGAERVLGLVRQLVGLRLGIDINVGSSRRRRGSSCGTSRTPTSTTS